MVKKCRYFSSDGIDILTGQQAVHAFLQRGWQSLRP